MTFVRFLMLLSLVVWVGGIIFFAFVVAPAVFSILPTRELAGNVVTRTLGALHWIGIGSGCVFLVCSVVASHGNFVSVRNGAIIGMIALTLLSQIVVAGKMQRLRQDMGQIDTVAVTDARRVEFNALHQWSTRLEVIVLLLGLVTLYDVARVPDVASPKVIGASNRVSPG